jgi:chloramphenicol 3-O-phosphotransferase
MSVPIASLALARQIRARPSPTPTRLITVDGCGGAGKSTLAQALAAVCGGVPMVRVDDFLSWHDLDRWWWPEGAHATAYGTELRTHSARVARLGPDPARRAGAR